jgi:hypothetical protein
MMNKATHTDCSIECRDVVGSSEASTVEYDWIDQAVVSIARACNLCGKNEFKQVEYEWVQDRQVPSTFFDKMMWSNIDGLEVELYRKFLFDESSVGLDYLEEEAPPAQNQGK